MKCAVCFVALLAVAYGLDFTLNFLAPSEPTAIIPQKPPGRKQQFEDLPDLIVDDSDDEDDEPQTPKP